MIVCGHYFIWCVYWNWLLFPIAYWIAYWIAYCLLDCLRGCTGEDEGSLILGGLGAPKEHPRRLDAKVAYLRSPIGNPRQ